MNIAIIKHIGMGAPEKEYLFQVPSKVKIQKGTIVKVKTKLGFSYGILTRDSFEADGEALEFIKQTLGAAKKGELSTVTALMTEIPVCEAKGTFDAISHGLTLMCKSDNDYSVSYTSFPVKYRAKRKDNGEIMESPCVYRTNEDRYYLGTQDVKAYIDVGAKTENIYNMDTAYGEALFVEIDPKTLEWRIAV